MKFIKLFTISKIWIILLENKKKNILFTIAFGVTVRVGTNFLSQFWHSVNWKDFSRKTSFCLEKSLFK